MSRRSDIIAAIKTQLGTISKSNSYATDLGFRVYVNQEPLVEATEKPYLVLFTGSLSDSLDGETPPSQGEENHFLPIEVEAYLLDEPDGSLSELARDDMVKALKVDQFFGGLTEGFEGSISSDIERDEDGEEGFLSVVTIKAVVFFVTAYGEV